VAAEAKEGAVRIYAKGDRVTQPQYGPGTVTAADAQHTVIDFDSHGLRTFLTSVVALETTTEPAPARAAGARRTKRSAARTTAPNPADTPRTPTT
jgi:hypothetical protein